MARRFVIALGMALALGALTPARAADTHAPADFVVIVRHAQINRPAAQAWKRVGSWCGVAEWLPVTCSIKSGSGDVGSIRRINDNILEVMVARSPHSYTYWQIEGTMAASGYHGTVSIVPDGPNRSTVNYTLVYNQAAFPTAAERTAQHQRLMERFQGACDKIKKLAEAQP